jgi:peptidyl-tRNA hydrolase, PTH1 family
MILMYGLGNNEEKYLKTKHNIGRLLVEKIALDKKWVWKKDKTCSYIRQNECVLLYSEGYMNHSGIPVRAFMSYYKLDSQNCLLLVIQDDSDQIEGSVKLVRGGGSAGHNGINSIYANIPSGFSKEQIWRLKIGIRPPLNKSKSETFVLSSCSKTDYDLVNKTSDVILNNFSLLGSSVGMERLQNSVNSIKLL